MASDPGLASSGRGLQGNSLCQNRREHEVFLSHSGMQKPFVHDLFKDFLNVPRFQFNKPFFDVQDASLPKGEKWKDRLIKAARNCKVAVLILTKDYLTSLWPMLELLHFIDAQKTDNPDMKLVPVFYDDLLPSHLSDEVIKDCWKVEWEHLIGTGSSVKLRRISLTVELCQEALRTLKDINGIKARSFESFELLRKDIVSKVLKHLPSGFDPEIDPDVEGGRRLCDMISQLFQEDDGGRQCLGLYGMGGLGKTTMCKALCSYFAPSFNHKVYHLQIGSNDCKISEKNLFERHKELLRKLIGLSEDEINRIQNPRQTLKMHLGQQPVFLAVDDVRHDEDSCREVRAYVNYLCSGSKIIITARSRIIVESVIGPKYCNPIPNLNKEEALSLLLKVAAPERILTSLDGDETKVLQDCLQICFFSLEEGGSRNSSSLETDDESDNLTVPTKVGHYHPLALRAVASYFKDQYSKLGSIVKCGLELRNKKKLLFSSDPTNRIFDILGFGFHEICHLDKQLFIDVALYAPRRRSAGDDDEYIFAWLVHIHVNLSPHNVHLKVGPLFNQISCPIYTLCKSC
ncbi:hypothetical protein KC19_7G032500 [Ceratodon purpureus]|uniref:TIR domain-containing protein n=1 Tax=Ceratodon purpureus TaxID=3225 RepID=A0A8T0H5H4_CERPU|nr:hypothetical protein KC19_7G032500 [Ceratodon purpureus]